MAQWARCHAMLEHDGGSEVVAVRCQKVCDHGHDPDKAGRGTAKHRFEVPGLFRLTWLGASRGGEPRGGQLEQLRRYRDGRRVMHRRVFEANKTRFGRGR